MHPLLFPLAAQALLPLGMLAWVGWGRQSSRMAWALGILLTGAWIVAIALAGIWLVLPWYLPVVYGCLLALAAVRSLRLVRSRPAWPAGPWAIAGTALAGVALAAAIAVAIGALAGRRMPDGGVELAPPLRNGTYLVANGGSNVLVSAHVATLREIPRFRPWRGQSYGVDLVRVGPAGLRAHGLQPKEPAEYLIFGDTVVAPCAGRVIAAVDGLTDLPVPEMDRAHMAGNHVVLECGTVWILLAHLRRGSVRVAVGSAAVLGEPLGLVGNTGNTGEPHLHIHAQTPGTAAMPMGGEPVPVTFGGRYLVRSQRVRW